MKKSSTHNIEINEEHENIRLDQALAKLVNIFSRSQHKQWILSGQVTINQAVETSPRYITRINDKIILQAHFTDKTQWATYDFNLDIVYQDDDMIVINKPPGLVMHPGAGQYDKTLANALLHHFPENRLLPRAGVVHRLDKLTSGLCVVARTIEAYNALVKSLQDRQFKRFYLTIVHGQMFCSGQVETFINRHPTKRIQMAVSPTGKHAITHYKIIKKYQENTLLEIQLETGRTHQIRVHMAHIKHPVCADPIYNKPIHQYSSLPAIIIEALQQLNRQALHAWKLSIPHPNTKEIMTWEKPMPENMQHLKNLLDRHQEISCYDYS